MKVKTQKTVKEGENVGNGADKNGKAAGDGVAAENNKVCQVRAVNQFVQIYISNIQELNTNGDVGDGVPSREPATLILQNRFSEDENIKEFE